MKKLLLLLMIPYSLMAMEQQVEKDKLFALTIKPIDGDYSEVNFAWDDLHLSLPKKIKTSESYNVNLQSEMMLQAIEDDYIFLLKRDIIPTIYQNNLFVDLDIDEDDPTKESPYYKDHLQKIEKDILYASGNIYIECLEKKIKFIDYLSGFSFINKNKSMILYNKMSSKCHNDLLEIDTKLKQLGCRKLFNFSYEEKNDEPLEEKEFTVIETPSSSSTFSSLIRFYPTQKLSLVSDSLRNYINSWRTSFSDNLDDDEDPDSPVIFTHRPLISRMRDNLPSVTLVTKHLNNVKLSIPSYKTVKSLFGRK